MKPKQSGGKCLHCSHFRNTPEYLESEIKGWITLGSAYGSVRKDDGICLKKDLYLSAYYGCEQFNSTRQV